MNSGPILIRELRLEARRTLNFWLRVAGAAAVLVVLSFGILNPYRAPDALGGVLFYSLNATVFAAIWIIVPFITADCISRERREGTLGLLFLTELTPAGVVLGKSLSHFLRAVMIFSAMLPALVVPFLFGGITWKDVVLAFFLNSGALLLSFAAGLLASVHAHDHVKALVLAGLISVFFALAYMTGHFAVFLSFAGTPGTGWSQWDHLKWFILDRPAAEVLRDLFSLATGGERERTGFRPVVFRGIGAWGGMQGGWAAVWTNAPVGFHLHWIAGAAMLSLAAALVALLTSALAALRVRQNWREEPPSAARLWLANVFCRPWLAASLFRSRMRRSLDRNPIGWLQQYSWSARTTKWGWCLAFVVVEVVLVTDSQLTNLWMGQYYMAVLLLLSMALASATSFRNERQTGALELLLVTPLREWQIIGGRMRGVWAQFFPAALILALAWLQLSKDAALFSGVGFSRTGAWQWQQAAFPILFLTCYLFVPAVGLALSVKSLHFISAWIATAMFGIGLPMVLSVWIASRETSDMLDNISLTFVFQAMLGGLALLWLRHFLRERKFIPVRRAEKV